jgi:hypothetical protein
MAGSGEMPMSQVKTWERHTPKGPLPERLHKKAAAAFFDELVARLRLMADGAGT